jgi:hypothetical protein
LCSVSIQDGGTGTDLHAYLKQPKPKSDKQKCLRVWTSGNGEMIHYGK